MSGKLSDDILKDERAHFERTFGKTTDSPIECCDVCHEPVDDGCACQDEYRREHDSRDMER